LLLNLTRIMDKTVRDSDNRRKGVRMLRLYSKGCEYTLRALICLTGEGGTTRMAVREVCRRARIPEAFTRKMFQRLVRQGVLRAVSGPGGGYQFSRAADTVSLLTIITMVDGAHAMDKCVMGFPACDGRHPCALHPTVGRAKTMLVAALKAKTLGDVSCAQQHHAVASDKVPRVGCSTSPLKARRTGI
jgi:Rrf2 family protein